MGGRRGQAELSALCTCSSTAAGYRKFASNGGVIVILAGNDTIGTVEEACVAPMALLSAVLGPSAAGLSGCGCTASSSVAQLDQGAAIPVLGEYQTSLLTLAQGPGFQWSLPLSGGLPLTCSAPFSSPGVFDLYPTSKRE
jgi:hypothetical protein